MIVLESKELYMLLHTICIGIYIISSIIFYKISEKEDGKFSKFNLFCSMLGGFVTMVIGYYVVGVPLALITTYPIQTIIGLIIVLSPFIILKVIKMTDSKTQDDEINYDYYDGRKN